MCSIASLRSGARPSTAPRAAERGRIVAEFALIAGIAAQAGAMREDVLLGIGDDAALLQPPCGEVLVACTDTLNAGVHFPPGTVPADIGWKALAVNLSDLAAMGATPRWALLALSLPAADAGFVAALAEGFDALAHIHGVALVGGDTTRGPLAVTVTALGSVPRHAALRRAGAQPGDAVLVTGTLGDAAAGLRLAQGLLTASASIAAPLRARLDRPQPRIAAGLALRGIAHACIDLSDGLLADLGHICAASGVGAELEAAALPLSPQLRALLPAAVAQELALAGGDDYELCCCVPPAQVDAALRALQEAGSAGCVIGRIVTGEGVRVRGADGHWLTPPARGYEHFA